MKLRIFFIILIFTVVSCTTRKVYDSEFLYKKVPVLVSIFKDGEPIKINVFWNLNPETLKGDSINNLDTIKTAEITIKENDIEIVNFVFNDSLGYYSNFNFKPKQGYSYELTAKIPNYNQELKAITTVPLSVEIDGMSSKFIKGNSQAITVDEIRDHVLHKIHLLSKSNDFKMAYFFRSSIKHSSGLVNKSIRSYGVKMYDERYYGNKEFFGSQQSTLFLFDDRFFHNNIDLIQLYSVGACIFNGISYPDFNPEIVVQTLSEDLFYFYSSHPYLGIKPGGISEPDYIISEMKERNQKGPVYSNVINGVGIFAGYSEVSKIIEKNCYN